MDNKTREQPKNFGVDGWRHRIAIHGRTAFVTLGKLTGQTKDFNKFMEFEKLENFNRRAAFGLNFSPLRKPIYHHDKYKF